MDRVIVTTPEELKSMLIEVIRDYFEVKPDNDILPDMLSLDDALILLKSNGYPTSKSKAYKLTAANEMPYRKYGTRFVFSRTELLAWAASKSMLMRDNSSDGILAIARSAKKKR